MMYVQTSSSRAVLSCTAKLFAVFFLAKRHLKFCLYLLGHKEQACRRERCSSTQESPHLLWQSGGEGTGASGKRRIRAAGKRGDESCNRGWQHQHKQRWECLTTFFFLSRSGMWHFQKSLINFEHNLKWKNVRLVPGLLALSLDLPVWEGSLIQLFSI